MENAAREQVAPDRMDWFFEYSAAVTQALDFEYGEGMPPIPWPHLYAALAGLNNSLLNLNAVALEGQMPFALPIKRAQFIRTLLDQRKWPGTDLQLRLVLDKFETLGFIKFKDGQIMVQEKLVALLKKHALEILKFMTGKPPQNAEGATLRSWLSLNREVFDQFFYGDYGNTWRELRAFVNDRLNKPGEVRKRTLDYVNDDPAYWVVLNVLALLGTIDGWDAGSTIKKMGLAELSGNAKNLGGVLEHLADGSVVVREGDGFSYALEYQGLAKKVRSAALPGLRRI